MSLKAIEELQGYKKRVALIDVFLLKPLNEDSLFNTIRNYNHVITIEEAFINKGGLDTIMLGILNDNNSNIKLKRLGFKDKYLFMFGKREFLYKQDEFDKKSIIKAIIDCRVN